MKLTTSLRTAADKATENLDHIKNFSIDARGAMALQSLVLGIIGIGVIAAIGIAVVALDAHRERQ